MGHPIAMQRFLASVLVIAACGGGGAKERVASLPEVKPPPGDKAAPAAPDEDRYLWLEEITGERALEWATEQNARSERLMQLPGFDQGRERLRAIMDSKDKIPYVAKQGKWLYNTWQDADHPRGLYRRTTLKEYRKAEPKWETVLDIDALGKAENESWVFHGMDCLRPKYVRCLVSLSRGGADAEVVREFDLEKKAWVTDGFNVPEAKTSIGWKDENTVYIGTDFGAGSMSSAGYPLITKEWKRGTPLSEAVEIFRGEPTDISAGAYRTWDHGKTRDMAYRSPTTFTGIYFLRGKDGFARLDLPEDAGIAFWDDQAIVSLRTDWAVGDHTWPGGSTLICGEADFLAGKRDFQPLFSPTPNSSLEGMSTTRTMLLTNELVDVHNVLYQWKRSKKGWVKSKVATPALASFGVWAYDEDVGDDYWFSSSDYLTPSALELQIAGKKQRDVLKKAPALFDAKGLETQQHFATSADGTKIPYFQISRADLPLDGSNATLIEGYGGFEISLTPGYSAGVGAMWLERGGVYVVPNLRGGGEYGPAWHRAAIGHNRQRVYDDFAAIAQDLIDRKVTSPQKLGIRGGSNGGLLVGVMMTQRPDLFGAVVCQQPLLDMKRYHRLLAGASWMEEYGDPDKPEDWQALSKYSPYQNVSADAKYPPVLFTTSTRDDRVHPGHARKMAARMIEQGHDVLFYENIEGGHGGAADSIQASKFAMLTYAFLADRLGLAPESGSATGP